MSLEHFKMPDGKEVYRYTGNPRGETNPLELVQLSSLPSIENKEWMTQEEFNKRYPQLMRAFE